VLVADESWDVQEDNTKGELVATFILSSAEDLKELLSSDYCRNGGKMIGACFAPKLKTSQTSCTQRYKSRRG
jgi:hypothetical protein